MTLYFHTGGIPTLTATVASFRTWRIYGADVTPPARLRLAKNIGYVNPKISDYFCVATIPNSYRAGSVSLWSAAGHNAALVFGLKGRYSVTVTVNFI